MLRLLYKSPHPTTLLQNSSESIQTCCSVQDYVFKMYVLGSLSHTDMEFFCGVRETQLDRIDPNLDFLLVIRAQKAGTTWLGQALFKHPLFAKIDHSYRFVLSNPSVVTPALCVYFARLI